MDKLEYGPGFLLWQTTMMWQRLIKDVLEKSNITHPQFVIMALMLWSKENNMVITQAFIVQHSKLDKMTVSKSMKELILKRFMSRVECKKDTRFKNVFLTPSGEFLIKRLIPLVEKADNDFFKNVNQNELVNIFNQIVTYA